MCRLQCVEKMMFSRALTKGGTRILSERRGIVCNASATPHLRNVETIGEIYVMQ